MNQDIYDNEDFRTRLDSSSSEPYGTRKDISDTANSHADPMVTRRDASKPVEGNGSFVPPTSVDSENSALEQRIRIPLRLAQTYESVKELPTRGAEADLLVVREKATGQKYILKLYRKDIFPKEKIAERIQSISEQHPEYFIQLIEYFYSQALSYEILEYLEEGSLADFIAANKDVTEKQSREILEQLSSALATLHKNDIVHRDLKPSNVLIRQRSPLKLALIDFGISSLLDKATRILTSLNATAHYASPEALSAGDVSTSSDLWSLGIMMVELLTGEHPFSGMSEQAVKSEISQRSIDLSHIHNDKWKRLCEGLLLRDSKKRWGSTKVNHWLEGKQLDLENDEYFSKEPATRPYIFCKESYYTPQTLAVALCKHWDDAVKRLLRGNIRSWIKDALKDDDLYNDIRDIEEGITNDSDLKLLLAITRLNPDIEPLYRQHSLTEDGLAMISDSENHDLISHLLDNEILSIYGRYAQKEKYILIHSRWKESLGKFRKALNELRDNKEISNEILENKQKSSSTVSDLLKFSIDKAWKETLWERANQAISSEAIICDWFQKIAQQMSEDSDIADMYLALSLAPIAIHNAQLKISNTIRISERFDSCKSYVAESIDALNSSGMKPPDLVQSLREESFHSTGLKTKKEDMSVSDFYSIEESNDERRNDLLELNNVISDFLVEEESKTNNANACLETASSLRERILRKKKDIKKDLGFWNFFLKGAALQKALHPEGKTKRNIILSLRTVVPIWLIFPFAIAVAVFAASLLVLALPILGAWEGVNSDNYDSNPLGGFFGGVIFAGIIFFAVGFALDKWPITIISLCIIAAFFLFAVVTYSRVDDLLSDLRLYDSYMVDLSRNEQNEIEAKNLLRQDSTHRKTVERLKLIHREFVDIEGLFA